MIRASTGSDSSSARHGGTPRAGWRRAAAKAVGLGLAAVLVMPVVTPPALAQVTPLNVTVDEIAEAPDAYWGRTVRVNGEVGDVLGPRSFVLEDDDLLFDEGLPVVATNPLVGPAGRVIEPDAIVDRFVWVTGTVHQFNIRAFEDQLGLDLDDEVWAEWRGQPVIIATSISYAPGFVGPVGAAPGVAGPFEFVTVDDIAENPAAYVGQTVRVNGEVEEIDEPVGVGYRSFALEDSDFLFDEQILVIGATPLERAVGPGVAPVATPFADLDGRFVWVTGEVRPFNILEFERELGVDLDDTVYDDWEGQAAIIARSIRIAPIYPDPYGPYVADPGVAP
ncbi:MAG: hypothetical protein M3O34_04000 [Chloroflexota bacterium]|nr:hypothetical protein [Chloroflexota bacterium]